MNMTRRYLNRSVHKYWQFYLCLIPIAAYFVIFHYWPMYGVQIAFRDYNPIDGVLGSPFVGLKHFLRFFNSYQFQRVIRNTLGISLYQLVIAFPAPIILAIMLSELRSGKFRKTMQMLTYAPHFLSVVVVVGMMTTMLSPRTGIVNYALRVLGLDSIYFFAEPLWFKTLYVFSGLWQNCGWGSIIYIAAIAGIDPALYEAAIVDGASTLKRILHVTIPCIMPTIIILLILQCGQIMSIGFEKVFLMQNNLNMPASDVISTYVYRAGLINAQISFASAVGLFNSVINCALLVAVNTFARKHGETSLF
jgi:putative aldouronate transport system permease protein